MYSFLLFAWQSKHTWSEQGGVDELPRGLKCRFVRIGATLKEAQHGDTSMNLGIGKELFCI